MSLTKPWIISVSRRTDIPAYFMRWFLQRLRERRAVYYNPFYPANPPVEVSLAPEDVAAFVFWSKNFAPMLNHLDEIRSLDKPMLLHYTINNYPPELEPKVPHRLSRHIEAALALVAKLGNKALVWRYDPIVLTTLTPPEWHIANFTRIASMLKGLTTRVYTSFATLYRKTERNLAAAATRFGFEPLDLSLEERIDLLTQLKDIASANGIELVVCCQTELERFGFKAPGCIDALRLVELGMPKAFVPPVAPTRKGCRCARSRDIGAYETCPAGCVYCYAVENHLRARQNAAMVKVQTPYLFKPSGAKPDSK